MTKASWWDEHPCNLGYSRKPLASSEFHLEVTARKNLGEPHLAPFADFPRWRGCKVVDAGCGIGTVALQFAEAGARVLAFDSSHRALGVLRARNEAVHTACVNLDEIQPAAWAMVDQPYALPVPADLVWCWGVLHHLQQPAVALDNFYSWLRPGGELRLMVYHRRSLRVLEMFLEHPREAFNQPLLATTSAFSEGTVGCPHTKTYLPDEIAALVKTSGFLLLGAPRVEHIFQWDIAAWRHGVARRRLLRELSPDWLWGKLERLFGWHILVAAKKPK